MIQDERLLPHFTRQRDVALVNKGAQRRHLDIELLVRVVAATRPVCHMRHDLDVDHVHRIQQALQPVAPRPRHDARLLPLENVRRPLGYKAERGLELTQDHATLLIGRLDVGIDRLDALDEVRARQIDELTSVLLLGLQQNFEVHARAPRLASHRSVCVPH